MKKILTVISILFLLSACCPAALAGSPTLSTEDAGLRVTYTNPDAASSYVYVLLDEMERIALVELNAGETWTPAWSQEGLYKVRAYYVDGAGVTQSEESDWTEVRYTNKSGPLYWGDFLNESSNLPSSFTTPAEYNDPVPVPTTQPVAVAPIYTLAPIAQNQPADVWVEAPAPTVAPAPTAVSYAGTMPCFDHAGIFIRISDNTAHAATKGRSGPGTDTAQIATLNIGEVFQVLDCRILEQGNVHWFLINKDGVNCWVASGRCERAYQ